MKEDYISKIQEIVARGSDIPLDLFLSKNRTDFVATRRQLSMFLCREFRLGSQEYVGLRHGGKDHGTVIHACKCMKTRIETDRFFQKIYEKYRAQIVELLKNTPLVAAADLREPVQMCFPETLVPMDDPTQFLIAAAYEQSSSSAIKITA